MIDEHKINDWERLLKEYPDFEWRFKFYYREILYLDTLFLSYKSISHDKDLLERLNTMPEEIKQFFFVYVKRSFFESIVIRLWCLIFDGGYGKNTLSDFLTNLSIADGLPKEIKDEYRRIRNKLAKNEKGLDDTRHKIAHGILDLSLIKNKNSYDKEWSKCHTYKISTNSIHKIILDLKKFINVLPMSMSCTYHGSFDKNLLEYTINVCEEAETLRHVKLALKQDQWSGNKMREKFYKDKEILLEKELRVLLTI